ncbi:MAG: AsmA-like C-terminal region-containing protein, partial [Pseudomonadota bacterium]
HTISDLKGALVVRDGVAEIGINEVQTAGGQAAAAITANANDAIPSIFGTIRADGLSVPILLALAGQPNTAPRADGLIGANLVFGFRGTAADEIAATINARGKLALAQGRLDNLGLSGVVGDEAADRVSDLALTVSIDGLENPLSLQGQAGWRGETVRIEAQSEVNKLIAGETAATTARLSSSKIVLGYEGPMSTAGPSGGRFFANGGSLRQAASWFGQTLPDGPGYGPFDISSRIELAANRIDLEALNLSIDDIKGTGVVAMTTDAIPRVEAALTFERLNLDPYLGATGESGSGGTSTADAGWSDEPIDFSFTRAVDLTLDAQVQSLVISGITTGPLALKTSVRNGVMQSDLTEMALYGGSGTATVTVNATGAVPAIQTRINLANVDAYPFLRDGAAFERIEGRLAFDTDLTTTGQSQRAMMSALNGDMRFAFSDGALRGINIARMMRQLTSNILSGWSPSDNEKTDFSELSASFQIRNGIAENQDLILLGPLVRVTGGGTVDLPPQTLSYRVEPKLVASLEGQGGNRDLAGFGVPIIVDGPWAKPRIYPDIQGILQNPEAGLRQLRALGGGISRLGEGGAADIVGSLTNGNPAGAALDALSGIAGGNNSNDGASPLPTNRRDLTNAAIGAVGGLLSRNRNQTPEAPAPATTALPVSSTGLPVPRAKPGQTSVTAEPSNTRPANPLERILENTDTTDPRELLNQGLGGLLNRAN